MENIFCEHRQCTISVTGCVARQKRATTGAVWQRGYGPGHHGGRQIPFDPVCRDCNQGKELMIMIDGQKYGAVKPEGPVFEPEFPEKVDFGENNLETQEYKLTKLEEQESTEPEKPAGGETIPYGYCHCGCGQKTKSSHTTDITHGWVKGEPRKYIRWHSIRNRKKDEQQKSAKEQKKPGRKPGKNQAGPVKKSTAGIMDTSCSHGADYPEARYEVMSSRKFIIDFQSLADESELRALLEKRAAENLRTVDAQATWDLVQMMRGVLKTKQIVVSRLPKIAPDYGPGKIRLSDYAGAKIEIEEGID